MKNYSKSKRKGLLLLTACLLYAAKNDSYIAQFTKNCDSIETSHIRQNQFQTPATSKPPSKLELHSSTLHTNTTSHENKSNSTEALHANLSKSSLPIYIVQPSTGHVSIIPWPTLAAHWDRNTTFATPIELSKESKISTPTTMLPTIPSHQRVAIIIHTAPKMGSLTLRMACTSNYNKTCGISPNWPPPGFKNFAKLSEMIQNCNGTHHFCMRGSTAFRTKVGKVFPENVDISFENIAFLHLYPFRNYDEWAVSAMKMSYDRGGDKECKELQERLSPNKCEDSAPELEFGKYPKATLSLFQQGIMHRINETGETHHILLYPFEETHALLLKLSEFYEVPLLAGSDKKFHEERKNGTCADSVLENFHECFSSKLIGLL